MAAAQAQAAAAATTGATTMGVNEHEQHQQWQQVQQRQCNGSNKVRGEPGGVNKCEGDVALPSLSPLFFLYFLVMLTCR